MNIRPTEELLNLIKPLTGKGVYFTGRWKKNLDGSKYSYELRDGCDYKHEDFRGEVIRRGVKPSIITKRIDGRDEEFLWRVGSYCWEFGVEPGVE